MHDRRHCHLLLYLKFKNIHGGQNVLNELVMYMDIDNVPTVL